MTEGRSQCCVDDVREALRLLRVAGLLAVAEGDTEKAGLVDVDTHIARSVVAVVQLEQELVTLALHACAVGPDFGLRLRGHVVAEDEELRVDDALPWRDAEGRLARDEHNVPFLVLHSEAEEGGHFHLHARSKLGAVLKRSQQYDVVAAHGHVVWRFACISCHAAVQAAGAQGRL